jgi:hypothetical protein
MTRTPSHPVHRTDPYSPSSQREWRTDDGILNRVAGPAIEFDNGTKYWWTMGKFKAWQLGNGSNHVFDLVIMSLPGYEEAP